VSSLAALGGGLSNFCALVADALSKAHRVWRLLLTAGVVAVVMHSTGSAQTLSAAERSELEARKAALFQQTLSSPGNLDTAFAYADVSAKLGDNEAAVSALERMLLFNPKLPRVQLELAALYFRMGSYEIARTYFEQALAANPPDDVKQRINIYLSQIDKQSGRHHLSGFFFFGGQYQTDANIAPGSPLVHSPIGDVLLNSQFVKRGDFNVFGTGALLYSYDLGTQTRDTLEVGATGFGNHYLDTRRLDLGLVETTVGPRFNFTQPLPGAPATSVKPYAIVNDVSLGGNQYFHTLGVGGEANTTILADLHLKSIVEFRNKNFSDAPDRPLSRGLNGNDTLVSLFLSKPIDFVPYVQHSDLSFEFDFLNQDTRLTYFSNKTYTIGAAYRLHYDDPLGIRAFPWETTFLISHSWSDYEGPDPCCNVSGTPGVFTAGVRSDRHLRFGVTQSIQLNDYANLVLQAQRDIVSSNLPLYGYTSNSFLIGPQIRF
jgi:hypothetical protein